MRGSSGSGEGDLRERYYDEEGFVDAFVFYEVRDEGDGLDGFF